MLLKENYSLKALNTFGIEATARYFAAFTSTEELSQCIGLSETILKNASDVLVLGGGSNILFTGKINGLVLKNEIDGIAIVGEDADHVFVQAGAGVGWHRFVLFCIEHELAGAENLSLIPGSVGASPMQNIGAYGVELKDIFYELEAFHIKDKCMASFSGGDCAFGYRESVFKNKCKGEYVITSVTFRLNKVPAFNVSYGAIEAELLSTGIHTLSLRAISDAIIRIRQSKLPDPAIIGNAGSFFKNPTIPNDQFEDLKATFRGIVGYPVNEREIKLAAGWLIEQCGWKGYRDGDAGCHVKQALVLVNYGEASGSDILGLSDRIIQSVKLKFKVELTREVNIV